MTREQWFKLPLKIRQRWWRETDYGKHPPSDELAKCVREFFPDQKIFDQALSGDSPPN